MHLFERTALFLVSVLSMTVRTSGQTYDFSAATAQLANNLDVYGNRVVVVVEHETLGEIFYYQNGFITRSTKLGIASCTKWLSGAVVLACVDRGLFKLDDRIGDFLPIFNLHGKGDITIRQCFAMNSGFYLRTPDYELDSSYTLAESVNLIAENTPIVFPPGTQLAYEGDGMQVVGRICEVVTGKDWNVLAREVLFDPLDMPNADYANFAPNPAIAGGARSSADEYLKFLRMVMNNGIAENGNVVLTSRSVQEFFINQTFGLPEFYSPIQNSPYYAYGERPDYGMGSWIMAQNPTSGIVEEVASPGAFGTFPWVDRKRGLRGIIFMFGIGGVAIQNNLHTIDLIREEIDLKGLPAATPASPLVAQSSNGFFQLNWQGEGVMETSTDLINWTPLNWATSPFVESLTHPPAEKMFYRLIPAAP